MAAWDIGGLPGLIARLIGQAATGFFSITFGTAMLMLDS